MALVPMILSVACTTSTNDTDSGTDVGTTPTETVPQFLGRVPRNIVMVSLDTFRRDALTRYGGHGKAPFLDALAADGFVLDHHVQCSNWTFSATSCTLSGRYNIRAGMEPVLSDIWAEPWPEGTPFLASHLLAAGRWSVLSSTNGWLAEDWGNTQGYNLMFHPASGTALGAYFEGKVELEKAIADGRAKEGWLLHVHATEPHAAYSPPEEYLDELDDLEPIPWDLDDRPSHYEAREEWPTMTPEEQELLLAHLKVRYAGEIASLDDELYTIYLDLDAEGLLDDAMLVVWTDHGEAFWEHGYQTHAYTLHGEENDGIAMIWAPNIVPQAWSEPTSAIDLAPTLLSLLDLPGASEMDGVPVGTAPADRPLFSMASARLGVVQSVYQSDRKLIFSWYGTVREYDRSTDPGETTNLYRPDAPSAESQALWDLLEPEIEAAAAIIPYAIPVWPAELRD